MELSDSKIKKFLIFPEMGHCNFQPKLEKIHPEKISCASGNRKPPKKIYIFSRRKSFLYFRKRNFLIFQETLSNFPRLKREKKRLVFQRVTYKG